MEKDDKLTEIRNFFLLTLVQSSQIPAPPALRLLMLEAHEAEGGS